MVDVPALEIIAAELTERLEAERRDLAEARRERLRALEESGALAAGASRSRSLDDEQRADAATARKRSAEEARQAADAFDERERVLAAVLADVPEWIAALGGRTGRAGAE